MFQFDQFEADRLEGPLTPASPYAPVRRAGALSFLWWSEHCIECAAPACYASCSLYQRRPDGGCRRLVWGLAPDRRFAGLRDFGVDVAFKAWGKLEADVNPVMEPADRVLLRERLVSRGPRSWATADRLIPAATRDAAGRPLPCDGRRIAKKLMLRALDGEAGTLTARAPEAFLVEVYNPAAQPMALHLTIRVAGKAAAALPGSPPPPVLARLDLPPGFSRHWVERKQYAPLLASGLPCKIAVMPEAEGTARLVFLALDFVAGTVTDADGTAVVPEAGTGTDAAGRRAAGPVKCVVFDLDDTLWDGVLVETGTAGEPRVRPAMAEAIRALDARGILLSIASKNDREPALARLQALGLGELFLHPQIDWSPKSGQIRRIAGALNIGVDAIAFVDDSPFERAEVAAAVPPVLAVPPEDLPALLNHARFQGAPTADGRQRRRFYQIEQARLASRTAWGEDYLGFLSTCEIELTIDSYHPGDFERVSELVQRTNQLNYSGSKYAPAQVAELIATPDTEKLVLRCRDRFGSYGTVGFVVVRRTTTAIEVEEFMMSCRVQGRCLERALFATLINAAGSLCRQIRVRYRRTDRNGPAARILDELGFTVDPQDQRRILDVVRMPLDAGVVTVVPTRGQ